jgi:hypothetical protein
VLEDFANKGQITKEGYFVGLLADAGIQQAAHNYLVLIGNRDRRRYSANFGTGNISAYQFGYGTQVGLMFMVMLPSLFTWGSSG